MALKKSQLYSSLWQSCDELRGGMDASQYKDYVLTLLFMKYVSDKFNRNSNALIEVPENGSFTYIKKAIGSKEIGEAINKAISNLAEKNDLVGVIDQADFNDDTKLGRGKEMQDRLSRLVSIFDSLDFGTNYTESDDLLGDAYEYLMMHFATESGKSKGQFYTPAEVSRVMAKVIGIGPGTQQDHTIYDPTCGSGSLLLRAADEAPRGISVYGQEMDNATYALARMNMILHDHETADLRRDNTLAAPRHKNQGRLKTFDYAVANPPFSAKAWSNGIDPENDEFGRFAFGIPPTRNGDYAFLQHLIASLNSKGKGAIILPNGVLFRGNREAEIRKNLIRHGFIKGIIRLPPNLFYGTGIPACIVIIDKENAYIRSGVFMIDASKGFIKDGNKNRLRAQDIHRIVDVFNRQIEFPRYSRMVPTAEIASTSNDYNLNVPRYVDSSEPEDLHDLEAHLHGGIPDQDIDALEVYWDVFPSLRQTLFVGNGRAGYSECRIETEHVRAAILNHEEFETYIARIAALLEDWTKAHKSELKELGTDTTPRNIIRALADDILVRFADVPLIDPYEVYQCLMDYWEEVMQDDVYLVSADGWVEAAKPRGIFEDIQRKIKETPDLTVKRKKYKMDLIPPRLIVSRFFSDKQAVIEELLAKQETATRELDEFVEVHTGEEGLLAESVNDKGKVTKSGVTEQLKTIRYELECEEEREVLERCRMLIQTKADSVNAIKETQARLDEQVLNCYTKLTEEEIKTIVVEDKWFSNIEFRIKNVVQTMARILEGRVKELEERYFCSLPELEREVESLSKKVEGHLRRMGITW